MTPAEKMSHLTSIFYWLVMEMIQGAMQPGVPHLCKVQGSSSLTAASPKSTIIASQLFSSLNMIFSSLMSLCIISNLCMQESPEAMPLIIILVYSKLMSLTLFILSIRFPPQSSSVITQMVVYYSYTYSISNRLSWSKALRIKISLLKLYLLCSLLSRQLLSTAFAAKILLSQSLIILYTTEVLPLPIRSIILQSSKKPSRMIKSDNLLIKIFKMLSCWKQRSTD